MADYLTELQTLTDAVAALQRQINDLSVIIQSHSEELTEHEGDITGLQDPPSGVPLPLIEWLDTPHSIREVDTILDDDLTDHTDRLNTHQDEIDQVEDDLTQEIADRTNADTALSSTDVDLQSQIDANLISLNDEITGRGELATTVSEGLDAVNDRVDDVQNDLSVLQTSSSIASASLSDQIASTSDSLQTAQTQIALLQGIGVDPLGAQASQITTLTIIANDALTLTNQEKIDRGDADLVLQSSIDALSSSISGISSGLTDESNDRQAADADLAADIASIDALASGNDALISAETAARVAADDVLTDDVADNTTDIADNATAIGTEVTDRTNADVALQSDIDANTASIVTNTANIATHDTKIVTLNSRLGVVKDVGGYITDWWVNDGVTLPGAFKLKNLNNDVKLQNPGYVGKYFPAVSVASHIAPSPFDADWGGATTQDFTGGDLNNYTRNVKVSSPLSIGIGRPIFMGVDFSTLGNANRLGNIQATFKLSWGGYVNRYLSVWYRLKTADNDPAPRWIAIQTADNFIPSARTYEWVSMIKTVVLTVDSDKLIEFGITPLNGFDATIADAANDQIYSGYFTVEAYNLITIL